ncbi:MAG: amidohydrolase family protein [Methylococcaceae bacterium]
MQRRSFSIILMLITNLVITGCTNYRRLASFQNKAADCFDRKTEPYTSIVDAHIHFRPFSGAAIPFAEITEYLERSGVRFANVYGIGQGLPIDTACTSYLRCPGTPLLPTMKNDFLNAINYLHEKPQGVHLTLAMTFLDLANPKDITQQIRLLDREFPGLFRWAGEVNLVKQAFFKNQHQPTPIETIKEWSDFMTLLRKRGIPLAIHSDLGNDNHPTQYQYLMEEALRLYPENKIVWMHMGLSNELTTIDPDQHIRIMKRFLDDNKNLMLDIAWRIIYDHYFSNPKIRSKYVAFFNQYSDRILSGTDFVAKHTKTYNDYEEELDINSRINQYLSDKAFRNIALGQNYFRLLKLDYRAPRICSQ